MKKLTTCLGVILCSLFICHSVYAENIDAHNLRIGDFISQGDIIQLGDGEFEGIHCINLNIDDYYYIWYNGQYTSGYYYISRGTYRVVPHDCYVCRAFYKPRGGNPVSYDLYLTLGPCAQMEESQTITVNEGDSLVLTPNLVKFADASLTYTWKCNGNEVLTESGLNPPSYTIDNVTRDMDGDKYWYYASVSLWNSPIFDHESFIPNIAYFTINVIPNDPEPTPEPTPEPENPPAETTPQTPSTVPNGTAQISIDDGKGGFANIKALNPLILDSINQRLIADLYASSLKKRASVLVQKNLYPPYGVKNSWKATSHTIRWKDLNVKKGDKVVVIWYTPTFWGHTSTLKTIQATVVEDGVVEFTIPSIGDMSVMSIVKLK